MRFPRLRRLAAVSVSVVLATGALFGFGTSAASADDPTFSISGTVQDSDGNALQFANVALYGDDPTTPLMNAGTYGSGGFSFSDLAPGSYKLVATNDGFVDDWYDGASDYASAAPVVITDADQTNIAFTMHPVTYDVHGTVTGGSPAVPLAGQTVELLSQGEEDPLATTVTDSQGHYDFPGFPEEQYAQLHFVGGNGWAQEWWQNEYAEWDSTTFDTSIDPSISYDVTLARVGTVSGRVTVSGNATKPVAGADVTVQDPLGNYLGDVIADSRGYYTITGIPSGQYKVSAVGPDYADLGVQGLWDQTWYGGSARLGAGKIITVPADGGKTGINIGLRRDSKITGELIDTATHHVMQNGAVEMVTPGGSFVQFGYIYSNGKYEFDTVKPGTYRLKVFSNELDDVNSWYGGETRTQAKTIRITSQHSLTGLNIHLVHGGHIDGHLIQPLDYSPAAKVELLTLKDKVLETSSVDLGEYGLTAPAGHYKVKIIPTDGYYAPAYYEDGYSFSTAKEVTIHTGDFQDLHDMTLGRVALGTITGKVVSSDGSPVSGLTVNAYGTPQRFFEEAAPKPTTVNANGTFTMTNVPAGKYTLDIGDGVVGPNNYHNQYINGDVFTVHGGKTTTLATQTVTANVTVTGTVTDSTGPVANATVQFYTLAGVWAQSANTGDDGTYSTPYLPAGRYRVRFLQGTDQTEGGVWLGGGQSFASSQILDTSSTTEADGTLVAGSTIKGIAVDSSTKLPVDNLTVIVYRLDPDGTWYQNLGNDGDGTDGTGHWSVTGLMTGTYAVEFTNDPFNTYATSYDGKSRTIAHAKKFVVSTVGGTTTAPTAYIYRAS